MKKILTLTVLLIASCGRQTNEINTKNFVVNLKQPTISVNYEDDADEVKIIQLETTDKSTICEISRLFICDSLIFIFDADSRGQNILKFDINGKFLARIGMKGRSAKEYQFFNDVYVDDETSTIYAYERYRNKMYYYDFNGTLLKTTKCAVQFNSFTKVGNSFWTYSCFTTKDGDRYNLTCLDETLEVIKSQHFPQGNDFVSASLYPTFSQDCEGNAYFYYPMSDGIYYLTESDVELRYKFDFGDRTKPYEQLHKINDYREYDKALERSYLGDLSNLQLFKGYLFVGFKESGMGAVKSYTYCYNVKSNKGGIMHYNTPKDPIRFNFHKILGSYGDYLIALLPMDALYPYYAQTYQERYNIKTANSDNPALAFFKINRRMG